MELLVVVAILVVLVGVATPLYLNYLEQSKMKTAYSNAKMLSGELKNFAISHDGEYPPEGDWTLLPLEKKPPLDPWGQPYRWGLVQTQQVDTVISVPVVISNGPDRTPNTADDITSQ